MFQTLIKTLLDGPLAISGSAVNVTNDIVWGEPITITNASAVLTNRKKTIFELVKVDITANVVSFSKRGMTKADTEVEDASLKKQWKKGDYLYITVLAPDIVALNKENERLASQDFTGYTQNFGNTTHTGYALFQGPGSTGPIFPEMTTAQRTATTPIGPAIVYDTDLGELYKYYAGAWTSIGTGTFPRASETVEGKVRVQTDAEYLAKSDTGSDGATLVAKPSKVADTITTEINKYSESYGGSLIDDSFMLGEPVTAGQCVFLETGPATGVATTKQNIGDVAANTRVSFPAIGAGVAGNGLKLNIAKVLSPTAFLRVRLETDNAGSPSGTLVDDNATKDIDPATLTTSLVDTTVLMGATVANAHGVTLNVNETSQTVYKGVKFTLTQQVGAVSVDKVVGCTATKAYLYDLAGDLLTSASFSTNTATLNYNGLVNGQSYYIMAGSDGSSYTSVKQTGVSAYPYTAGRLNYVGGGELSTNGATASRVSGGSSDASNRTNTITVTAIKRCKISSAINTHGTIASILKDNLGNNIETSTTGGFNTILIPGNTYQLYFTGGYISDGASYDTLTGWTDLAFVSYGTYQDRFSITTVGVPVDDTDINNITSISTNDTILIPSGQKVHIVVSAVGDVVNASNYYNIGYSTNNTTTRPLNTYETSRGTADNDIFPYVSSTLFQNQLLSLTDANYTYKIDLIGVAIESKGIGTYPKLTIQGINGEQSGLTQDTKYYLSGTPGDISSTPGTVSKFIGEGLTSEKLILYVDPSELVAGTTYTAFNLTADTVLARTLSVPTLKKSGVVIRKGTYTINFSYTSYDAGNTFTGQIYRNGSPYGTLRSKNGSGIQERSEDLFFSCGDIIGIYVTMSGGSNDGHLTIMSAKYNIIQTNQYTGVSTYEG